MKRKQFIKQYILPYESCQEDILRYLDGSLDYDNEYLLEVATYRNIKIKL